MFAIFFVFAYMVCDKLIHRAPTDHNPPTPQGTLTLTTYAIHFALLCGRLTLSRQASPFSIAGARCLAFVFVKDLILSSFSVHGCSVCSCMVVRNFYLNVTLFYRNLGSQASIAANHKCLGGRRGHAHRCADFEAPR